MAGERQTGPDTETIERLRAQNKAHAERRDQEVAGLQKKVARTDHLMAEARRRMEHAAVVWTTDPPSQKPGGWWRYTSVNNVYEVAALVAEIETIRAETVAEIVARLREPNAAHTAGWTGWTMLAADFIEREFGCDAENGETA